MRSACRLWRYNWSMVWKNDGRTTDGRRMDGLPSCKLPWSLRPGYAKTPYSEMKGMQEKEFIMGVRGI